MMGVDRNLNKIKTYLIKLNEISVLVIISTKKYADI
jgi:hypothetical protein